MRSRQGTNHLVILNIGAAHTKDIEAELTQGNVAYAVVTPLALKNKEKAGELGESYERKDKNLTVLPSGFLMQRILAAAGSKKPEPLIAVRPKWFEYKALVYRATDRVVAASLGTGGGSGPGGGPPTADANSLGFDDDESRRLGFFIDPRKVEIDHNGGAPAVIFPIELGVGSRKSILWVKATKTTTDSSIESATSSVVIESMLKDVVRELSQEASPPQQAEDKVGRVRMSSRTIAVVGASKAAVTAKILSSV
jgi:hypothetical protein